MQPAYSARSRPAPDDPRDNGTDDYVADYTDDANHTCNGAVSETKLDVGFEGRREVSAQSRMPHLRDTHMICTLIEGLAPIMAHGICLKKEKVLRLL